MKYRHLFFDLDHTLWDFDTNAREALTDLYARLNLSARGIDDFDKFYQFYLHHNTILWDRYHKGFIGSDELKWKRMWRVLLEFKIGDEALAREMSEVFLELLPARRNVFPYTFEILDYLKSKDYQMHMITNGFEKTQWRKLRSSGLDKYFDIVITSEASNSIKPNREIFAYALEKTGARLEESIMIGDNLEADIEGAVNAGMDSIFVNHVGEQRPSPSTYTIYHLKELEEIL